MVVRGDQVIYCRKEGSDGSRLRAVETCLRAEQIRALEQDATTLQRQMDRSGDKQPVMNMTGPAEGSQPQ